MEKECGNCLFFCNGKVNDYCDVSGEPVECYETGCKHFKYND